MDEGFSGVVKLSNISDFIAPNLNCIIPLETIKTPEEPLVSLRNKDRSAKPKEQKPAVKVSLSDCLACNGCITTAETVLVEEQSLSKLLDGIANHKLSVVTVSPQSVCSIAVKRNLTVEHAAMLIAAYFSSKGVHYVLDSSFGRSLGLQAAYKEFKSRSERPIMASACPGFVCYAEKTHGNLLVPLISKIRSPQAIQGAIVKDYLAKSLAILSSEVYHASVMPCFDKKLEASRQNFMIAGTDIRETDCVISTAELDAALSESYETEPSSSSDSLGWLTNFSRGNLIGNEGGASGGYAECIVQNFISENGGVSSIKQVAKNLEVIEVCIGEEVKLRVARVYGFRNIQNMVRKLKVNKCNYDYVEVMACPGGCANGGGQLRAQTKDERDSHLAQVQRLYDELRYNEAEQIRDLVADWSSVNSDFQDLLFTDYHIVETHIGQNMQW